MSELSPTPTPTFSPTPIPKKARIQFSDGYSTILNDDECCCPKALNITCSDLTPGKYYTVRLKNLTNTRSRIFPESMGFLAGESLKNLQFFVQFECDEDKLVKPNTTYSLTTRDSSTKLIMNPYGLNYEITRIRSGTTELNTELFSIEKTLTEVILKLDDSIVPSLSKPIRFNLLITGPNIVTSHKQVVLDKTGDSFEDVNVVNLDTPTNGIVVAKKTMSQTENGLSQAYSVTVPKGAGKEETATISFQPNTKLYDSNGEQLVGDVNIVVAHFSNTAEESLEAFPGGFAINGAIDQSGDPIEEDFFFYSAGFLSIEAVDSEGRVASVTSRNLNISAGINGGTINYGSEDKDPIAPGDSVPVWSLSRDGVWRLEGSSTLDSNLNISFDTNHFTTWNWDWKENACPVTTVTIPPQILSQSSGGGVWVSLYADPSRSSNADVINARYPVSRPGFVSDSILTLTRYPRMPITVTFYKDKSATTKLGEVYIDNCSSFNQPLPTQTQTPTLSVTPTQTPTLSITPTNTPTVTPYPSNTPTQTVTPSITKSSTPAATPTPTVTPTYTPAPAGVSIDQ